MGGTIEAFGLRYIAEKEPRLFSEWEKAERPYPWTESQFEETRAPGNKVRTVVLEREALPKAFACVHVVEDEAYLSNIMVNPAARRKGCGTQILQKVMMWVASEGARRLMLDVDVSNLNAIGLYRKLGFEIIQRRTASYPRGEDAYVMRKPL